MSFNELSYWNEHCRNCVNTFDEEQKHYVYGPRMGLPLYYYDFNVNGASVLDVGGGPVSMLLKCYQLRRGKVIDPLAADWPDWVKARYTCVNIEMEPCMGEDMNESGWDEVWVYNCLQHVRDPELVLLNCKKAGKLVRIFEWISPAYDGHAHSLTQGFFEKILGSGSVAEFSERGCSGKAFFGAFRL